jgi:hypothetical protein
MAHGCRRMEGGSSGAIPEVLVQGEGSPLPLSSRDFRTASMVANAEFCAPDALLNQAWNDIMHCAIAAEGAAPIAAMVASPAAALPAFSLPAGLARVQSSGNEPRTFKFLVVRTRNPTRTGIAQNPGPSVERDALRMLAHAPQRVVENASPERLQPRGHACGTQATRLKSLPITGQGKKGREGS